MSADIHRSRRPWEWNDAYSLIGPAGAELEALTIEDDDVIGSSRELDLFGKFIVFCASVELIGRTCVGERARLRIVLYG